MKLATPVALLRRGRHFHAVSPLVLFACCGTFLAGCDGPLPKAGEPPEPASGAVVAGQRAEFDALFSDWTRLLGELRERELAFHTSSARDRQQLAMKHYEQLAEGYTLERDLLTAAMRAFTADPERNEDLKEFLLQIASLLVQAECYEDGLNVCQMLRDNDVEEDVVLQNTAEAAFACSEFEIAEQCLRAIARRHGDLAENSRRLDVIDRYKEEWAREEQLREAERLANDLPRVLLVTALGEIELELFEREAPNTVANFITLVEQQFYDGLVFHEVKPRFAARAGCPLGDGSGSPGHFIRHECDNLERRVHFRGSLTTVSEGPVANGSQFYLTFAPTPELEGRSTVFGRVVRGLEVLARLQRREATGLSAQVPPDPILLARVIRKGSHDYRPAMIPDPTAKQREEGAKMMRKMLSR